MILTYGKEKDILISFFPEVVTDDDLYRLPEEFDLIEKEYAVVPNRLISLCGIKSFNADFSSVMYLAEQRNKKVFPNSFKTALLVCNKYQMGFARMYQTFNDNPNICIEIFEDELKAMEWLKNADITRPVHK